MHFWAGSGGCPGVKEDKDNLKSLLSRAADALEWPGQLLQSDFRKLIDELRKAAE
jgi:hypothetical protein